MEKLPNFKNLDSKFKGKWNDSIYPSFHRAVYDMHHVKSIKITNVSKIMLASKSSVVAAAKKMGIYTERTTFKVGANINTETLHSLETLKKMDRSTKQTYNSANLINGCIHYTVKTWHEQGVARRIMAESLGVKIENIRDCLRRMQLVDQRKKTICAKPIRTHVKKPPLTICRRCGWKIRSFTNQCNWCRGKYGEKDT